MSRTLTSSRKVNLWCKILARFPRFGCPSLKFVHLFKVTNLSNSPLGGVTPSDPETLQRSPLFLLPSPLRQGSGSLPFAGLTGNRSLPLGASRVFTAFQNYTSQRPSLQKVLCHLTRTPEGQWRRPCYAGAVLEGVGFWPALTTVLATEEGLRQGPGAAGKGSRAQWLRSTSSRPGSRGKGILFHPILPTSVRGGTAGLGR